MNVRKERLTMQVGNFGLKKFSLTIQNLSNYASFYRCCTAAAPCKDRVTVITFGSDVPFVKQVQHDEMAKSSLRSEKPDVLQ